MRLHARVVATGAAVALGLWLLGTSGRGTAADDEEDARKAVEKLADTAAKSPDALQKEADAAAKKFDSLEDIMNLMKKRTKADPSPFGFFPKPTGTTDDGIEIKVQNLSKRALPPAQAQKEADLIVKMAHRIGAIGAIALAKTPTKKMPDKDPKDWKEYSEEMIKASRDLAKAAKAPQLNPKDIKEVAARLNASCNNCHGKFRD
jgi:cytochrome c556